MSQALPPVKAKTLIKIFESWGFSENTRKSTAHITMSKSGCKRPLVISAHGNNEIISAVYMKNVKTAGKTRQDFLEAYHKYK